MAKPIETMKKVFAGDSRPRKFTFLPTGRTIVGCVLALSLATAVLSSAISAQPKPKTLSLPATITLRGTLFNGTHNRPTRVDKLELIALKGGMRVLTVRRGAGPSFAFKSLKTPRTPLLLRATYRGERYAAIIPPSPRFWKKRHRITVYERKPLGKGVRISAAMQLTKTADILRVTKIFAISNKTRYTAGTDEFHIPLPAGARAIRGSLEHDATRVPAPLTLNKSPKGYRINKGFRPGNSALRIEFTISGHEFKDRIHSGGVDASFQMVWWRPADAKPRVTGGNVVERKIPRLGPALRVDYPPGGTVAYDLSSGGVIVDNPMTSDTNPIFESWGDTLIGMGVLVLFFFAVISILSATGLKVVRRDS